MQYDKKNSIWSNAIILLMWTANIANAMHESNESMAINKVKTFELYWGNFRLIDLLAHVHAQTYWCNCHLFIDEKSFVYFIHTHTVGYCCYTMPCYAMPYDSSGMGMVRSCVQYTIT